MFYFGIGDSLVCGGTYVIGCAILSNKYAVESSGQHHGPNELELLNKGRNG